MNSNTFIDPIELFRQLEPRYLEDINLDFFRNDGGFDFSHMGEAVFHRDISGMEINIKPKKKKKSRVKKVVIRDHPFAVKHYDSPTNCNGPTVVESPADPSSSDSDTDELVDTLFVSAEIISVLKSDPVPVGQNQPVVEITERSISASGGEEVDNRKILDIRVDTLLFDVGVLEDIVKLPIPTSEPLSAPEHDLASFDWEKVVPLSADTVLGLLKEHPSLLKKSNMSMGANLASGFIFKLLGDGVIRTLRVYPRRLDDWIYRIPAMYFSADGCVLELQGEMSGNDLLLRALLALLTDLIVERGGKYFFCRIRYDSDPLYLGRNLRDVFPETVPDLPVSSHGSTIFDLDISSLYKGVVPLVIEDHRVSKVEIESCGQCSLYTRQLLSDPGLRGSGPVHWLNEELPVQLVSHWCQRHGSLITCIRYDSSHHVRVPIVLCFFRWKDRYSDPDGEYVMQLLRPLMEKGAFRDPSLVAGSDYILRDSKDRRRRMLVGFANVRGYNRRILDQLWLETEFGDATISSFPFVRVFQKWSYVIGRTPWPPDGSYMRWMWDYASNLARESGISIHFALGRGSIHVGTDESFVGIRKFEKGSVSVIMVEPRFGCYSFGYFLWVLLYVFSSKFANLRGVYRIPVPTRICKSIVLEL